MSADEDTELRDLVAQTLENNGVLGKIRAQLRASVFLALEEQESIENGAPLINHDLKKFISTKEGVLTLSLVREFLQYFNLDFTLAVFDPETNIGSNYESRDTLAREVNVVDSEKTQDKPLLYYLMKKGISADNKGRRKISSTSEDDEQDLTSKQVVDARQKFEQYDKDDNGMIDKDELRGLFLDIFPHFHKNMLDRYVNDEFRSVDKDFSSGIDFEEFLAMYRRLFVLCKGVVAHDVSDIVQTSPRLKHSPRREKSPENGKKKKEKASNQSSPKTSNGIQRNDSLEDAFFDEPLPDNSKNVFSKGRSSPPKSPPSKQAGLTSLSGAPPLSSSGLGSLKDAPPLPGVASPKEGVKHSELQSLDKDLESIDKLAGYTSPGITPRDDNPPTDDYEDDFQSSSSSHDSQTQPSQSQPEGLSGITEPTYSMTEEIEEDIDDDFLVSSNDKFDELTTDRSISQLSQSGHGFDYAEEAQLTLSP
uniref:FGFR1 oncogene partner-like n=1 Tax=Saccoglossus kowalevskii TaxID=10224 RepID=A0ABM0M565_SACKO|nr:PREDICTED: FGFR1 oncogene partner-like [Saccoglossus kowalevskii]